MDRVFKSTCRMCHGGCGVLLHVKNGSLVRVEGDRTSPMNYGAMCIKGQSTIDMVYHPDRIVRPMKRVGMRGKGEFKYISWDEALDDITGALKQIIRQYGPEGIAFAQGTGRHHYIHLIRLANALGCPNWIEPGAAQCFLPRVNVSMITYGDFLVSDYYSGTPPKCGIFWGSNPVITGADGKVLFSVRRVIKDIPYTFAVDPRISETAQRCRYHLQLRPGTDMALALAMIHIIIRESLYDKDFVETWTSGFDRLADGVKTYTPDWAADITGLEKEAIVNVARTYAVNKPGIIDWGVSIEQTPNSLQTCRSIAILRGITGNVDKPGSDVMGMHILSPLQTYRRRAMAVQDKRLGADTYKLLGGRYAFHPTAHIPSVFAAMRTGKPYPIKAFLIFGNNGLTTFANPKEYKEALMNMDLVVSADFFRTPTAEYADYFLPAAMWPEVNQIVGLPYIGENGVSVQQKVIQTGECKQDEEIFVELAKRLDLDCGKESIEELIAIQLQKTGLSFEELKQTGHYFPPLQFKKYQEHGFKTPSRKVELYSQRLEELGYDPLPSYCEPPESPVSTPHLLKQFPYVLITGRRSMEFFHSEYHQHKGMRSKHRFPQVEIHPETAGKYKIKDGDWVKISSPRGSIYQQARVTDKIRTDVISIEHAWWYPEIPGFDYGIWESNANILTNNKPPYDPAFGSYQLRALLCNIEKEEPAELLGKIGVNTLNTV